MLARIFQTNLNRRNETLDQRGHFVILESKINRVVEDKLLSEIQNNEMACTKIAPINGIPHSNLVGLSECLWRTPLKEEDQRVHFKGFSWILVQFLGTLSL